MHRFGTRLGFALFVFLAPPGFSQPPNMQAIAQALGVSCDYCHAATPGAPQPKKDIARAMMAMTKDINARIQEAAGQSAAPAVAVTCETCHRGVPIPQPLGDILSGTIKDKGVDAALEQYRDLRKKYFGRDAYDFSEGTLIAAARPMVQVHPDDSIALLKLNLEFYPRSADTYAAIAFAYTRKLDDDSAIANLEKALEIDPDNGVLRGQLEQLKSYHRPRK